MSSQLADPRETATLGQLQPAGPTLATTWIAAARHPVGSDLLRWPPDLFAFTDVILDRSEAYRFAVSPPPGREWPEAGAAAWQATVESAARRWCEWVSEPSEDPPDLVAREWAVIHRALDTPLEAVSSGRAWRLCEALLNLHAIADEACAGLAVGAEEPGGARLQARLRDLLARSGTLSRIDPGVLRVLPKYRTAGGGITSRSISRYAARTGPAVDYHVHRVAAAGRGSATGHLNILLLPWPLRVDAGDFQALPHSINRRELEPFGFFRYEPGAPLDVSMADRMLSVAAEHAGRVDLVVLPESAVADDDVAELEATLSRHEVPMVIAGVRAGSRSEGPFGANWVHFGASVDGRWRHYRQDKHHRWSLDRSQIAQYHLEEVLDPRVRWWEAIEIRHRSLEMVERDEGDAIAALVCEDLAQLDEVADLLRAVGPTLVVALLLDGPQLASRWTARYASVLADDPGSSVLTLTSYGMVANAWRPDRPASSVVALWRDNARGQREIELEPGAEGILLSLSRSQAIRRAADGRAPRRDSSDLRLSKITQLRAAGR
jgi:hypothetical protein